MSSIHAAGTTTHRLAFVCAGLGLLAALLMPATGQAQVLYGLSLIHI